MSRRNCARRARFTRAVTVASGIDPNLATLLAAPGAQVIYNADYGYTKDVSNKVSGLSAQLGPYTLAQATGAQQPTHGAVSSPTGRVGITFATGNRLVDPASVLAQLLDGTQQYSSLIVATNTSLGSGRCLWCIGNTTTANESVWEGHLTAGQNRAARAASGASSPVSGSITTTVSTIHTMTATSSTNAGAYSAWMDGAIALSASATMAGKAPVCDVFAIGGLNSGGAWSLPWIGEFYFLILSTSVWSAGERQALEAAAKAYFGTP